MADWKSLFSSTILSRGKAYYRSLRVRDMVDSGDEYYHATVIGTRPYEVSVKIEYGTVVAKSCNCPYGSGCKHEAAVLYELEEAYGQINAKDSGKKCESVTKQTKNEEDKLVKPFQEPQSYQYFNLAKIMQKISLKQSLCEKARKLIRSGEIKIEQAEVGYTDREEECSVKIEGTATIRNIARPVEVVLSKGALEQCYCYGPKCNSYYYGYRNNLCEHELALLFLFEEYQKTHVVGDETDVHAAQLLYSYKNKKKFSAGSSDLPQCTKKYHIEAKLERWEKYNLRASFRIGTDKLYVVKDLYELVDHITDKDVMKLGKNNEIDFALSTPDEKSAKILDFIKTVLQNEKQWILIRQLNYRYDSYGESRSKDKIDLYGDRLDTFFDLYEGSQILLQDKTDYSTKDTMITMGRKIPKLELSIRPNQQGKEFAGVKVSGKFPACIEGNKAMYYLEDNHLYRFEKEETAAAAPLIKLEKDGRIAFKVGRNRLGEFYHKVLPTLEKVATIKEEVGDTITQYLPPEAQFVFYLDAEDNNITCVPEVQYGDESIALCKDEKEQQSNVVILRDAEEEQAVMEELQTLFPYLDEERAYLHCAQDQDVMYDVLNGGVDRMLALGEVHSTDRFKRLTLRSKMKVTVGVAIESDLMNLSVLSDDVSREELMDILNSYRQKKRFHRLKNGDFVNIEADETIEMLSDMLERLHIKPKDFVKGKMNLPVYRALYLDKMLEANSSVYAERDRNFKKMIKEFKTVNESDFEVPQSLKGTMRNYQIHGYKWLRTLAAYGFGGILADDMGLGKTLQMISVLLAAKEEGEAGCSLIVAPASLIYNWREECERFAPTLKTAVVAGTQAQRSELLAQYEAYDVLITSYDLLKRDIDLYEQITFQYQVIDEAQYIKTHTTAVAKAVKVVKSKRRFALTGTPIENRLSELWSIFDYLMPGYLYTYEVFRKELETPIVKHKDELAMTQIKRLVKPFILRRLKTDVLKDLPAKMEEVRYAKLEDKQQKLYDAQVTKMKDMLAKEEDAEFQKSKIKILAELMKLRQICCDPSLFLENYHDGSAKTQACMDLIESALEGEHKILLFSQFTSMLSIIEAELTKRKIAYYKITGETKKETRTELVAKFNEDRVPIFLISLKAGGTGLNLTGADIVIHYDPWWNLAVQNQATDRAHRIGQTKTVSVYKLIIKSSIEEKILKMQEEKKNLADEILNGETGGIASLSKEELLELIG